MHFVSVAHFFVETHTEAGQGNHLKQMTFQRSRDHTRGEGDPPGVKGQSTGEGHRVTQLSVLSPSWM